MFEREVAAHAQAVPAVQPLWGPYLLAADSNCGEILLTAARLENVKLTLDRFKAMGVDGISLAIGYPMLLPEFPRYREYREFYRAVAREIRNRRMKIMVEQIVLFVNSNFSPFQIDLGHLTMESFATKQADMAQIIIQNAKEHRSFGHGPLRRQRRLLQTSMVS